MKSPVRNLGCCLLALLPVVVLAQAVPSAEKFDKLVPLKVFERFLTTMGPPQTCSANCEVTITMSLIGPDDGYCLATLGDVTFSGTASGNRPKSIVWKLSPPTLGTKLFYFQPKNGILVVDDPNAQMFGGGVGDGSGGPNPDVSKYHFKNKHNKTNTAIFLPIVLQTDTTTGVVTMCGAADPKIVNN